jgi:hypothetical protein
MGAGKIDAKPLITDRFGFEESIASFDYASDMAPRGVKVQVEIARLILERQSEDASPTSRVS